MIEIFLFKQQPRGSHLKSAQDFYFLWVFKLDFRAYRRLIWSWTDAVIWQQASDMFFFFFSFFFCTPVWTLLIPASFSDDHLGADLVEPLPQLGALQLDTDLSVRPAVPLLRLVLLPAGLRLFSPGSDRLSVRLTGSVLRPPPRWTCFLHLADWMFVQAYEGSKDRERRSM